MTWFLAEPAEGILLQAEEDGLWLRSETIDFGNSANFATSIAPKTRLGRFLPTLVPQLMEMGLAIIEEHAVRIPYDDLVDFEDQGIDAFDGIVQWAPFLIDLKTSGIPGRSNFLYELRFFWGRQQVHLDRLGCFVKRNEQIYRLDKQSYALAETIKKFNELPANEKETSDAFIHFAAIKGLSEEIGASIDSFIQKFRVIVPPSIGLDFIIEGDDRISFVPRIDIEGIPQESLHKVFLQSEDPTDLSIHTPDGELVKIVFNEEQKEVLRRMQSVRKFGGKERADVLRNPQKVFEGVAGAIDIDTKIFGNRVKGIGDFPFISQPFVKIAWPNEEDPLGGSEGGTDPIKRGAFKVGIKCIYADGSEDDVTFKSRDELLSFQNSVKAALRKGEDTVKLKGKTLVIDKEFANSIDSIVERVTKKPVDTKQLAKAQRLYLLIYENEETREYVEDKELQSISEADYFLPKSIISESVLKKYQKEGVRWLQQNYLRKRGGCLLADDMGLGKTLQILTFLAWLIERDEKATAPREHTIGLGTACAPWNPILIVAPIMLLESETWVNDMKTFFKNEGAIFTPHITLHGDKLKAYRKAGIAGSETSIGESVLNLEKLREFRVILTNYETVVNYQFSFAMMKSAWSVVITDEAQEYKTPKTKISHALKSLSPSFRIACTGTPVETRLMDVWNIFDFLQPGSLLGSAKEFNEEFVKPFENQPERSKEILDCLRNKLHFGKKTAYVLRRDKASELEGLPQKHIHPYYCDLSAEQREMHIDFIKRGRTGGEGNHPFSLIQQLMRLYQHPALIPRYEPFSKNQIDEAFATCPKLEKLLDILKDIRGKREKALIFTRSTDMQQILAGTINTVFGLNVDIVNGAAPRKGSTRAGLTTRNEMLTRFRESKGFNVIILSPDVAGVGITLVEANHVIHYGRWWNPAKESQATDRAYRIGQSKDVNVYYLIARDPQNIFKTFDEKLDALIERRKQMAVDFLAPLPAEDELGKELYGDIFSDKMVSEPVRNITPEDVRKLPWDRFEALIALLEEKQGRKSLLTPRAGDRGIDVISILGREVRLIQCKHTLWDANIDTDVIAETINGFDNYRGSLLRDVAANYSMVSVIVTNGKCTRPALRYAQENDIQVISAMEFEQSLEQDLCTHAEIENMESRRLSSISEIRRMFVC